MQSLVFTLTLIFSISSQPSDLCPQNFPSSHKFGNQDFTPLTHSMDSSGNFWIGGSYQGSKALLLKM